MNFVTTHDGFTLNDLVSYAQKHNDANGDGNCDGHNDNRSCNHGIEGPTADPVVGAARRRQMRNLLETLLLSQGTPMLLAGDEFARTQLGNNNAYSQDSAISWIDWDFDDWQRAQVAFVRSLVCLRREFPILRQNRFLTGELDEIRGTKDVTWLSSSGDELTPWIGPTISCSVSA